LKQVIRVCYDYRQTIAHEKHRKITLQREWQDIPRDRIDWTAYHDKKDIFSYLTD